MKALIFNSEVMQVESEAFEVHSDWQWVDCSDDCKVGSTFKAGVFTAPPEPPGPAYDDKFYDWNEDSTSWIEKTY